MTHTRKNKAKRGPQHAKEEGKANGLFVVGIGASAGGLQALDALFSSVPHDGIAYVIVQHLSSEHRSLLTELLSQYSVLEVLEAGQHMEVQANKVYVIPNDKELTIQHNHLQLTDKPDIGRGKTIDTFFTSLAADKKEQAIGVVLSGTGTDGTEGAGAIKEAGGLVLVQDPATARFDSMPRSVIDSGYADFVLPPEAMSAEVFNHIKVMPITETVSEGINKALEPYFLTLLDLVHERTGIDFSKYKRPTIIRRISRRMAAVERDTLSGYLSYLRQHPEEVEMLSKDFLIGVTKFFRDEEAYQVLAAQVLPPLIKSKGRTDQLRVWIAGCSSGEEAYSIAILIREHLDTMKRELDVKIFASDIDREALDFASRGMYAPSSMADVSPERLSEFFVQEEGKYRIAQRVRRMVIFAPHNVANDPPFSKIDLVSCRNMLIYLNPLLQRKVLERFHYALRVGGYLMLGSSESIGDLKGFVEINKKWKIFQSVEPANSMGMLNTFSSSGLSKRSVMLPSPASPRDLSNKQLMQQSFNEVLVQTVLEEYGYAAVYVDENYDVLHGTGKLKHYLDLPDQNFTFNLLKLVPQDLAISLGTLLRRAIITKEKLVAQSVQVRDKDKLRHINVVVKPFLSESKLYQKFILVLFSEDQPHTPLDADQLPPQAENHYESRVQELELELQYTKEDLQAVVEELETANEELQSTNEELLSSNEELQSTNEELQSLNEELHTINVEHQYKIKALVELDDDLNNYFRSTDIGQIFVDRKLIIRKYTPAATRLINLIESDIGRSIYQISNNLRYDRLIEDVRQVIASSSSLEQEVQDKQGTWYQMRILPYITQERKIDGAIIIFIQINELKRLHLLHHGILDSSPNATIAVHVVRNGAQEIVDFMLNAYNDKVHDLTGTQATDLQGKRLWAVYPALLQQGMFERLAQVVETGEPLETEQLQATGKGLLWLQVSAVKFDDGLVLTLQNITPRKQSEQQLLQQKEELRANATFLRTLLEAVPHITWTNLPSGENSSFNEQWYAYTSLSEEESAGWGWKKAFHPDDLEALFPLYIESLQKGQVHNAEARILRHADNQYRWHLIKDVPIRNEAGEITLWVGTATDIQDQKDAQEANTQLRLSQQREILNTELKTQEAERGRISEALHNGLGQMLYALKLKFSTLPLNGAPNADKEQIDTLLKDSIAVTRDISAELSPSVLRDFGLRVAVEEMVSRLKTQSLKLTSSIRGCDKRTDYTTELSLYRIVQELLNNILKHSQASNASVEITCSKEWVNLCVQDNGIGMPEQQQSLVEGLGLHSIRNRVSLLGGKLQVTSSAGKGTTFRISLPCQCSDTAT